jgi:hypothetical protein
VPEIPRWAYLYDGYGHGAVAWVRGFQRLVVGMAGLGVAVLLWGLWGLLIGLLATPVFVIVSLLIDGVILHFWPQDEPDAS